MSASCRVVGRGISLPIPTVGRKRDKDPDPGCRGFAKGHGNINLQANTVSGVMCQQDRTGTIIMSVERHLSYHSHYATMWGYHGTEVNDQVPPL
jgi:hypothetical protein